MISGKPSHILYSRFQLSPPVFQENQLIQLPLGLRTLKNTNPSLKHFNIDVPASVAIGMRIFCPATWNDQNVTLCITFDLAVPMPQRDFHLAPITEFVDRVPKEIIDEIRPSANEDTEGNATLLWRRNEETCFRIFSSFNFIIPILYKRIKLLFLLLLQQQSQFFRICTWLRCSRLERLRRIQIVKPRTENRCSCFFN